MVFKGQVQARIPFHKVTAVAGTPMAVPTVEAMVVVPTVVPMVMELEEQLAMDTMVEVVVRVAILT